MFQSFPFNFYKPIVFAQRTIATENLTLPGLGGGGGGGVVGPRLTSVVYNPRTKNVEAHRLNEFS